MCSRDSIKSQQPGFTKNVLNCSFRKGEKMVPLLVSDGNTVSDHLFTVGLAYFYFSMRTNARRLEEEMKLGEPVFPGWARVPPHLQMGELRTAHSQQPDWYGTGQLNTVYSSTVSRVLRCNIFQLQHRQHLVEITFTVRTHGSATGTGWNGRFPHH